MSFKPLCRLAVLTAVLFAAETCVSAMDYADVLFQNGKQNIEGRFLDFSDSEGRRLFETRDRQFFFIDSKKLIKKHSDTQPFAYYTKKETLARLQEEFPESKGYYILDRKHFLVVYTTSRAFANWYSRLLEKLYSDYITYWKRTGVDLETAEYPLVAVVLSSKERYLAYAENEGVKIHASVCAYYNQRTNRVVMYDMSGKEKSNEGDRRRKDTEIFLQQPGSYFNVTTVVHEAAHQVGFNCGMHTRFAPNPVWVCEGLATFHEVPYAKSTIGWSLGPHLNLERLATLEEEIFIHKEQHYFESVVMGDALFIDKETENVRTAYAAAWGLMYYLANKKMDKLAEYLNMQRKKTPETEDSPKIRLREFEKCFGSDWDKLYKDAGTFYLKAIRDEERKKRNSGR